MKPTFYPMHHSVRCGAHARTTGSPCASPAMENGRCRMHGGKATGPAKGSQNNLRHGLRTAEAVERRKEIISLLRSNLDLLKDLHAG